MGIPVLGIAGYSGSGKTTLICNLIKILNQKGICTAVIKHDVHGISEDDETKDTGRFKRAGACRVKLCCGRGEIEEEKRMLDAAVAEVVGAGAYISPGPSYAPRGSAVNTSPRTVAHPVSSCALYGATMNISPGSGIYPVTGENRDKSEDEKEADVDLIFVEGFKRLPIPKLGIARLATGKGFCADRSEFLAAVSDIYEPDKEQHNFALDDYEGICEFIMERSISG